MKFTNVLLAGTAASAASLPAIEEEHAQSPLSHDSSSSADLAAVQLTRIPSSYESAIMARRILALTPLATLSTVFPSDPKKPRSPWDRTPDAVGGVPIGMLDYIADCEDDGNPTILSMRIATTFKNVAAGSNISVSLAWTPPHNPEKRIKSASSSPKKSCSFLSRWLGWAPSTSDDDSDADADNTYAYSAANLPRFSLMGHLESVPDTSALRECYVATHPDAKYWLPGNRIHASSWVRLVVEQIYWVGGFGDRAYIGWIPVDEWRSVSRDDWEGVRLPGEKKGWKEWTAEVEL